MQITLSSGNYDIIDSRQAFLFGEKEDLTIHVIANKDFEFSLLLKFFKDDTGKVNIQKKIVENAIEFSCFNFDNLGTGLSTPISIAKIAGREFFFMFWSYLEGGEQSAKVRSVKYTIFSEK